MHSDLTRHHTTVLVIAMESYRDGTRGRKYIKMKLASIGIERGKITALLKWNK